LRSDLGWLLLIHQIPPKPAYLRVKVWRRLQRLGAVPLKNAVYLLPRSESAQEDFQWVRQEIVEGGGEAFVCEARFVEGLSDPQIEALFQDAREADLAEIAREAERLAEGLSDRIGDEDGRAQAEAEVLRLQRRFDEVSAIDFFGAPGREALEALLSGLEDRVQRRSLLRASGARAPLPGVEFRGRVWVTRRSIHVDRIASAWLIRRFIDLEAEFRFVAATGYLPGPGELRFDMFEAEFTHEGDRCTFEVLLERFALVDPALQALAQIVHDIDLKDGKFGLPETPGMDHLIAGIAMAHKDDAVRLERGEAVFADLYSYFHRKLERDRRREDAR
jgi:hypothetical protein